MSKWVDKSTSSSCTERGGEAKRNKTQAKTKEQNKTKKPNQTKQINKQKNINQRKTQIDKSGLTQIDKSELLKYVAKHVKLTLFQLTGYVKYHVHGYA